MRRFIIILFSFFLSCQYLLATGEDDSGMTISLLTQSPSTKEVYTAWGHTAIRVQIPAENVDNVYNYGVFSFKNGFLYKFVKGETDYCLAVYDFEDMLEGVKNDSVALVEQVLNLTEAEKEKLYASLEENAKPKNMYYRYNFFFDNCATRPLWQIEKAVNGKIHYPVFNNTYTFRNEIYSHLYDSPWYVFGIDLALGSETDRTITDRELLFLPRELERSFDQATIEEGDSIRRLVSRTEILNFGRGVEKFVFPQKITDWIKFTPSVAGWLFFFLIVAHTIFYNYKKKNDLWLDMILYAAYGLLGCLVFFLAFISEHPCTNPNYNLLWVNPLQLIFALLALFRKLRKPLFFYQILNAALLLASLVGWPFIPQHYNCAFLPLMLILLIRSVNYIFHYYPEKQEKKVIEKKSEKR